MQDAAVLYKTKSLNPLKMLKKEQAYILKNTGNTTLFNINDTNQNLPPYATLKMYLGKNVATISYDEFNGENKTMTPPISDEKVGTYANQYTKLILIFVVGLLLYMIFYFLLIRQVGRKK